MNVKEFIDAIRIRLGDRQIAYRRLFSGPLADIVLKDLARFCRAHESAMHPDARMHALAEGRREVWLRIQEHLNLSHDQLWHLYAPRNLPASEE